MKDTIEMPGDSAAVSTVGRDDFFNDPFFKDWWADFDVPMAAINRQTSGKIYNMFLWRNLFL